MTARADSGASRIDISAVDEVVPTGVVDDRLKGWRQPTVPYGCPLTPSQLETLALIGEGLSYKEAAMQRRCTVSTIRTHVQGICSRLNVAKCAQAVLTAYRKGWLDEHTENQTSVQVRRLAEATEELVVHLQNRKRRLPPALNYYLASFDDLMLARDEEQRRRARDLMEESLARVLREKGIRHRAAPTHNSAFAELLSDLIAQRTNPALGGRAA